MTTDERLSHKYATVFPYLNERQRRLVAAADAVFLGHGGIAKVARAAGVSRPTVHKGLEELAKPPAEPDRIRRKGSGRKKIVDQQPGVLAALEALVDPLTRGDPMSPLRWTCKSTRQLSQALAEQGYRVSYPVVAKLLRQLGYSLQANVKTLEGTHHPDRDAQFEYLNDQVRRYLEEGLPVISVDTKKKELVGLYKNAGREWLPQGTPIEVQDYDSPDPKVGKAIPYGVYDVGRNLGWVSVGCDHDTASFAVESIRRWWSAMGAELYPGASRLLISADCGGSNGPRIRLWRLELQKLADTTGLTVTVCHLPPGTSRWNKIEHRQFSHISMNWRGRPLVNHEVVVELIGATTTNKGLRVRAELDRGTYPKQVVVSEQEIAQVRLERHSFHGDWNYTIRSTLLTLRGEE
jgi:hypothetical protein